MLMLLATAHRVQTDSKLNIEFLQLLGNESQESLLNLGLDFEREDPNLSSTSATLN